MTTCWERLKQSPAWTGLTGQEANPDTKGAIVPVQPLAQFQSQLDPDPDHHFPAVDFQIFSGAQGAQRTPNMQGFVKNYFEQQRNMRSTRTRSCITSPLTSCPAGAHHASHGIRSFQWLVLGRSLDRPYANRAFAHYGTSFGQVSMDMFYLGKGILSIYERLVKAGHTSKIYYYDQASSTMEVVNLLKNSSSSQVTKAAPLRLRVGPVTGLLLVGTQLHRSRWR